MKGEAFSSFYNQVQLPLTHPSLDNYDLDDWEASRQTACSPYHFINTAHVHSEALQHVCLCVCAFLRKTRVVSWHLNTPPAAVQTKSPSDEPCLGVPTADGEPQLHSSLLGQFDVESPAAGHHRLCDANTQTHTCREAINIQKAANNSFHPA